MAEIRKLLFASALLFAVVEARAGTYRPDREGFIRDWLVIGAYPSYAAEPRPRGFTDDLLKNLGGETAVEPYAGMQDRAVFEADRSKLIAGIGSTNAWGFTKTKVYDIEWKEFHWVEPGKRAAPIIDLDGLFQETKDNVVAYAACYLVSPRSQKVQFRIGSDDGYKLWVNHVYIGGLSICRAVQPNANIHTVELKKGTNLVLLKIVDRRYGHAFCLAVTDTRGRPCTNLKVVLDNPKAKFARECRNLERVDVIDGDTFAGMALTGKPPYFPGRHVLSIGLGRAVRTKAGVELRVTDSGGSLLHREQMVVDLRPEKAVLLERDIECEQAGRVTIAAVVKDRTTGTSLGHLTKTITILDPKAVHEKLGQALKEASRVQARAERLQAILDKKSAELNALREDIAAQYIRIEDIYARRRTALAEKYGKAGRSIDEPFEPARTARAGLCLNGDKWAIAAARRQVGGPGFDEETPPDTGWVRTRVPIECLQAYFRSRSYPVRGRGPRKNDKFYGPSETMPCGGDYVLPDARLSQGVWYRLLFRMPDGWEKRVLTLRIDNANTKVRVYFNGTFCGERFGWVGVIRIPLKDVKRGENQLDVYVGSARNYGFDHFNGRPLGLDSTWGIMGDVFLEATPGVAVTDVWAITSYRNARIKTKAWLVNRMRTTRDIEVRQYCVLDGRVRLRLGRKRYSLPPDTPVEVRMSRPWTNPRFWGIGGKYGEPILYTLVTDILAGGELVDRQFTRFGFREFWIEGLHFYLNGKRIFIQGDIGHFKQNVRRQLEVIFPLLRRDGINLIRNHQGAFGYPCLELPRVADELGMLVCAQMYPVLRPRGMKKLGELEREAYVSEEEWLASEMHYENLKNYGRWVRMMRNHPSVVIYSTDNEIFTQAWDTPEKLAANIRNDRLGAYYEKYVKRLDPTRVLTRDGDEGTWGHTGKWQEDPPCDTANYHYPDFRIDEFVRDWETVYDGRPVLFGETLYHSYGAWNGWVGATPSQVTAKARTVRRVASLYRDLEIPGAIYMGLSLDGFIQLDKEGCGPWRITPEMIAEYKADGIVKSMPRYPYIPVAWPSMSGPGYKREFARNTAGIHGERSINWFDPKAPTHLRNAVNDAYRDSLTPMPPLKRTRAPELLVRVVKHGEPAPFAQAFLTPAEGQAVPPVGVMADSNGAAWFLLWRSGKYRIRVGGVEKTVTVDEVPNDPPSPGFDYLKRVEIEIE
ncbi:MAG: hypothetical protein GXP31_09755 [Kiritimatiellaeota bacterium]|nr:hypothetical protein [Kiritimatiellota bacterium]